MNRDIVIAKIKRQQAEMQEMLAALNEEGDKFPRISKALRILHKNSSELIGTLEDDSRIVGPGLDISPEIDDLKKDLKRLKKGVKKMKEIEEDIVDDLTTDMSSNKLNNPEKSSQAEGSF